MMATFFKFVKILPVLLGVDVNASVTSSASPVRPWGKPSSSISFSKSKGTFSNIQYLDRDGNPIAKPRDAISSRKRETALSIRGGRATKKIVSHSSQQKLIITKKRLVQASATSLVLYGLFQTRGTWMTLFNKEKLQTTVVQTLENLNDLPYMYSRSFYTIAMAFWEALGMSTIPVETAAAMVFGPSAFYWSGTGKLLGACLAFGLGRGALSAVVEKRLSSNSFLELVQTSTEENPLMVVILIKLSCFPETIKNFGSSILKPIQWWMFVLATAVHGGTFTALWTYLGVDTAARLKDATGSLPPNQLLKTLLTLALINGIVVSPLSMAYWMRTLKQKQLQTKRA